MAFYGVDPVAFESVSAVTATNSIDVGIKRIYNGEDYVYVYNAGNSQASVGRGVILSAVSGYSVTVSSLTGVGAFFGVVKHATLTTATYGWVLTRGFANMIGAGNTAIVAGDQLVPGLDGSWAPATGAQTAIVCGQAQIATATAGTAYGFVKCWG